MCIFFSRNELYYLGVVRNVFWTAAAGDEATASSKETPTELPFQLQVTYTDLDGARAMRVLTQVQPVTSNRAEAETRTFVIFYTAVQGHFLEVLVLVLSGGLVSRLWFCDRKCSVADSGQTSTSNVHRLQFVQPFTIDYISHYHIPPPKWPILCRVGR